MKAKLLTILICFFALQNIMAQTTDSTPKSADPADVSSVDAIMK